MPTVSKVYTPADIFQGWADVYLDVAAPPSAIPPVAGTNTIVMNSAGEPTDTGQSGIHLGLTEGPVALAFTPKYTEIHADQFAGPIDAAYASVACTIEFDIKELNLKNYPRYFAGLATGTYAALAAGSVNPPCDFLQLGNSPSAGASYHTLMLVAPDRKYAGAFLYVFAYKAIVQAAMKLELQRKKEAAYKIKFACILDTTRVPLDQVLQIIRTT